MLRSTSPDISQLTDHPDAETLRDYDHPTENLSCWKGALTAKAWIGTDLACFFAGVEGDARIVLFFKAAKAYRPMPDGDDMQEALVGSIYELDVFVTAHQLPIIDRLKRVKQFT
jgi:hypothetical protein